MPILIILGLSFGLAKLFSWSFLVVLAWSSGLFLLVGLFKLSLILELRHRLLK